MSETEIVKGPAYRVVTPRLVIRCYHPADAGLLKDAAESSLEHLRPWMPWAARYPQPMQDMVEQLRRFRGQFDLGQDYIMGIFSRDESRGDESRGDESRGDESRLIGGTGLHPRGGEGAREIGYWIRADEINKGYATETAAALTRVGFEIEKLRRVGIHCDVANVRSAAVPAKLGYTHEATLPRRLRGGDEQFHDEMVWTLHAEDYTASPAAQMPYEAYDAAGRLIARG